MEIREIVQKLLQEMVIPDLGRIREENGKILAVLELTNKRLDDVNTHLADQSRRIDGLRTELTDKIEAVRSELTAKIESVHTELNRRMDEMHSDLVGRIDANNARIDRFFQDSVSKSEHQRLEERISRLENEVSAIKEKIAA